jgi:creatinine amidohydrolase/Fe(II)-dependent formamide hydrolase-like protein
MAVNKQTKEQKVKRPVEEGDWNLAFLFPDEVKEARDRTGLAILPIAPIEWHGPHLTMGCDPLLAHYFARRLAGEFRTPYYPPLFIGTERERDPELLGSLGLNKKAYIEGMDFPKNSVASAYFREETFALVVRDALSILFDKMKFKKVLIVNGHGAYNQKSTLDRLCAEFNSQVKRGIRVMWVYPGFPQSLIAGSIGHAASEESSMLGAAWPGCVDLSKLPKAGKLKSADYAIVDGETFDCSPTSDHTLREERDPRKYTDFSWGRKQIDAALVETVAEVKEKLLG